MLKSRILSDSPFLREYRNHYSDFRFLSLEFHGGVGERNKSGEEVFKILLFVASNQRKATAVGT